MRPIQEKWISARAAKGDREAFAQLYDAYAEPIYRFVYYKIHHKEVAQDITAAIFTKALEHIGDLSLLRGSFKTWVYTIARTTVIDHYRTQHVHTSIADAWDIPDKGSLNENVHNALQLEKVREIMQTLTADQRDILIMRLWQELSYTEIAEILGKSESACKMMYSRAIHELRKKIPLAALVLLLLSKLV